MKIGYASLPKVFIILVLTIISFAAHAQTVTYTYDALGRVTIVSHESADDRLYEYDDAGNRTDITVYEDGNNPPNTNVSPICYDWGLTVSQGTTATSINPIAGHCTDGDGDTLTLTNVTPPIFPTTATISGNYISFTWLDYGVTTVTFTVSDGNGGVDSAALSITRPCNGTSCL